MALPRSPKYRESALFKTHQGIMRERYSGHHHRRPGVIHDVQGTDGPLGSILRILEMSRKPPGFDNAGLLARIKFLLEICGHTFSITLFDL